MNYWLIKSEPSELSIDDLIKAPNQTVPWFGIRNYQARNYMKDSMQLGDLAFFYHSSCARPGIAGIVEVVTNAYPDETQFDPGSKYYDPKSNSLNPRWFNVAVRLIKKTRLALLSELRGLPELESMQILARGNRLSITPVTSEEWEFICHLLL